MMNEHVQLYDWFARMLSYPNAERGFDMGYAIWDMRYESLGDNNAHLSPACQGEAAGRSHITHHLEMFKNAFERFTLEEKEELYTRTFDINPIANLEIGWHLYGEQYERGEFLVTMRSVLRDHGIEESSELPDHLTHVLMALGRMKKEEAELFATKHILPSLKKILDAFVEIDNPYVHLLQALKSFIEQQHLQGVLVHE